MDPTILIINVPPGIEKFLRAEWGQRCRILRASSPIEVFERLVNNQPDAIITGYDLPRTNALDLLRSVRESSVAGDIPVAVFTRSADRDCLHGCVEAGASLVVNPATPKANVAAWFENLLAAREEAWEPPPLSANMAQSITTASRDVLLAMLGVDLVNGPLHIEKARQQCADVISSVSVSGFVSGGVTLFTSMALARLIAERMLGEGRPSDAEVVDAVGELTNMIAGNIKTCLCEKEELFSMSPPSVMLGQEVRRMSLDQNLAFLLPCTLQGERLLIEFNLKRDRRRGGKHGARRSPAGV